MLNKLRAKRNFNLIKPYLTGTILDIGAGNCLISELISEEYEIKCIDVADNNKSNLALIIYDGKKLPFKKKNFDTSLLLYVLHHSDNPIELIKEAARVTRKRIIVFEDLYDSKAELFLLKLLDLGNKLSSRNVPMPFNFKKENEWINIFSRYGKTTVKVIPKVLPKKQKMFIIDLIK